MAYPKINTGRVKRIIAIAASLLATLILFQACGGGGDDEAVSATSTPAASQVLEIEGLLATTDLGLGANRISFLLQTAEGLISLPEVTVASVYGSESEASESTSARFHIWPFGTRGNYVTELTFDKTGDWTLQVSFTDFQGEARTATIPIQVSEETITPGVGATPPMVLNKTLADVESVDQLTGWPRPDPELYQITIPDAVASGIPSVLVFSSPGFCTSPTCGPQADTVKELKDQYKEQANFIHIEVYDNPIEIQQDLTLGRYQPVVEAWGLPDIEGYLNESWVFIVDSSGLISSRYQGFASYEELEQGLKKVL